MHILYSLRTDDDCVLPRIEVADAPDLVTIDLQSDQHDYAIKPMEISPELAVAIRASHRAGAIIVRHYGSGGDIRSKGTTETYNLVTDADVESEQEICRVIRETFPDHGILGEEEARGDIDVEHLWVIDPLDGTNNFAHHIPHFAVSIAYYHRGLAKAAVVYNPVRGDFYWSEQGGGAYHNADLIGVSPAEKLSEIIVGVGFYYDRGAMMEATLAAIHSYFKANIHGVRRFGAAALDLCAVAEGQYGLFMEYHLSPWDFAAGRLILEEAGGMITTARGDQLPLEKTSVLASNGALHEAALEISRRHHP